MNILTFQPSDYQLTYSQDIDGTSLEVRDFDQYRWFTLGGDIVQSLMNKQKPHQVLMPVCQSMLLFLLWKKAPLTILNLGIGGASFERYFNEKSMVEMISVDNCPNVISMARNYFNLPEQANIYCQSAEDYLQSNTQLFDVVLCDIFSGQENVACVNQDWFYEKLSNSLNESGVASINLDPIDEQHVLNILHLSRRYFANAAIVEFKNYKNIVLLLSQNRIPDQEFLISQNKQHLHDTDIDFGEFISFMHYLPANKD